MVTLFFIGSEGVVHATELSEKLKPFIRVLKLFDSLYKIFLKDLSYYFGAKLFQKPLTNVGDYIFYGLALLKSQVVDQNFV